MRFSLTAFLGAFEIRDAAGKPYVIIGGQAVNYWAETYLRSEPGLAAFLPFVSQDIDLIGGLDDVLNVSRKLGLEVKLPHKKLMTTFAGAAMFKIGGVRANIEFVRRVSGVPEAEVRRFAVASERGGKAIRVLDPVSLLASKLNLALTVDQAARRDADHARILVLCTRAFLRDTLRGAEAGEWPARGWLAATERVLKLAESTPGRKAARKLGVRWRDTLPEAEIAASRHRQVIQFREKRLMQWKQKIAGWL